MKRKNLILATLAVALVLGMSVGKAWAYFTDSTTAEGSMALSLTPSTGITENNTENGPGTKTIRIQNTSEAVPVWVRVRVYAESELGAKASGDGWSGSIDGWFEYGEIVDPRAETNPLVVNFLEGLRKKSETASNGEETNVIVVYEAVPVSYDAAGNPQPANWND